MKIPRLPVALALLGWAAAFPPASRGSDAGALDAIFARWYVDQGGMGSAVTVRNYEIQESVELHGPAPAKMEMHVARTRDSHFRFEMTRPGSATVVQAFDGRIGWQAQPDWGLGLVSNPGGDPWVWQNDLFLAVRIFGPASPHTALKGQVANGRACIVARVTDAMKVDETCFFDRQTHQLLRFQRPYAAGSSMTFEADFDDFRPVEGLMVPFLVTVTVGKEVFVHHRSYVILNPPVDEASFVLTTAQVQEAIALGTILDRHDASIGGAALARIHSRVTHLTVEMTSVGMKLAETIFQKGPNDILEEIETPGMGREARGFDGATGWVASELQGYRPLKQQELAALREDGHLHLLGQLGQNLPFRRRVGARTVDGRPTVVMTLASVQGAAGTFYFDRENARLLRIVAPGAGDRTNSTGTEIDFSDFRTVDGVEIPYVIVQTSPITKTISTVQSVENNTPLDDKIFLPRRDL